MASPRCSLPSSSSRSSLSSSSLLSSTSLKREPGLLRVIPPSRVLSSFAAVFSENEAWTPVPYQPLVVGNGLANALLPLTGEGSPADKVYYAAEPASRVEAFISHVWASARWRKALALYYHLNVSLATTLATLTWVVLMLSIGRFREEWSDSVDLLVFMYLPVAVFPLALFFGHYLRAPARDDLKERGVHALPEIVAQSDRMIILWDTAYFERLWCCAEVAIFTAVHGSAERIDFVPLWVAPWVISNMVSTICSISCLALLLQLVADYAPGLLAQDGDGIAAAAYILATLPQAPLSYFALWRKIDDHRRMLLQFESFRLQDTQCRVEGDRDRVYDLVAQLYREAGHPIEAFNHFVRTKMSCHVEESVGRVMRIRYRLSFLLSLPLAFSTGVHLNQAAREELDPIVQPSVLVFWTITSISTFAIFPSVYPMMLRLMAACEHRVAPGRPQRLATLQLLVTVASNAHMCLTHLLLRKLVLSTSHHLSHSSASMSLRWCVATAAFLIFLGGWNYCLYR